MRYVHNYFFNVSNLLDKETYEFFYHWVIQELQAVLKIIRPCLWISLFLNFLSLSFVSFVLHVCLHFGYPIDVVLISGHTEMALAFIYWDSTR